MKFFYQGEVNVHNEDLDGFLSVAKELKIKGLCMERENTIIEASPKERNSLQLDKKEYIGGDNVNIEHFKKLKIKNIDILLADSPKRKKSSTDLFDYDNSVTTENNDEKEINEPKDIETYRMKTETDSISNKVSYSCDQCDYKSIANNRLKIHKQSVHELSLIHI